MTGKYYQIALKGIFSDCQDLFMDDAPSFFQLLEEHFDISDFIPSVFYRALFNILAGKGVPSYWLPFRPHSPEDFLHPYGFPAHPSFKSL